MLDVAESLRRWGRLQRAGGRQPCAILRIGENRDDAALLARALVAR
jgi:hypothetical protein